MLQVHKVEIRRVSKYEDYRSHLQEVPISQRHE